MEKLKPGDKYLKIVVLGQVKLVAFKNTEGKKHNPHAPDYKGDGIAIWINEKQLETKEEDVL